MEEEHREVIAETSGVVMALSVKAELQITGLGGGDISVDGVPWQYASVADLKTLMYEQLRLPAAAKKDDILSFLAGSSGQALADSDKLSAPHIQGKKLILRGADLPPTPVRRQWFAPGAEVLLHGLQGAQELNGKRAVVAGWDALKCRFDVIMDSTKLKKSVKPENIQWAWISPLLVSPGGGDSRQAHVPIPGAFAPTQFQIPGSQGSGPSSGAGYGSATGGGGYRVADAALDNSGSSSPSRLPAAVPTAPSPSPQPSASLHRGAPAPAAASTSRPQTESAPEFDDLDSLMKELDRLKLEKERAIEEEDYDRAGALKRRHQELLAGMKDLPGKLKAAHEELEKVIADKRRAVEEEDFKLASQLKGRQKELEAQVKALEDLLANVR